MSAGAALRRRKRGRLPAQIARVFGTALATLAVTHRNKEDRYDVAIYSSRAYRETAWQQTRKRLDLETHLRRDWRDVAGPHYRRHSWPDETHQAASGESCRIVRLEQDRTSITQRGSVSRLADAADGSADLSF